MMMIPFLSEIAQLATVGLVLVASMTGLKTLCKEPGGAPARSARRKRDTSQMRGSV